MKGVETWMNWQAAFGVEMKRWQQTIKGVSTAFSTQVQKKMAESDSLLRVRFVPFYIGLHACTTHFIARFRFQS